MSHSLTKPIRSQEVPSLDAVRPKMVKTVTVGHAPLREVIEHTLRRQGNLKATAADMGIDRAQLYRQLQSGHLTVERLEALGPEFAHELAKCLVEMSAPLETPKVALMRALYNVRKYLDEVEQIMEGVA